MLSNLKIKNFKSIENIDIDLGRVNVFIGENGAGKSNILEAIAFAGAAEADKLDNEFLTSRGVRVSESRFMTSAFKKGSDEKPIVVTVSTAKGDFSYRISNDGAPYPKWSCNVEVASGKNEEFALEVGKGILGIASHFAPKERAEFIKQITDALELAVNGSGSEDSNNKSRYRVKLPDQIKSTDVFDALSPGIKDFLVYSPENSALKALEREGQIEPLGINGEGLLKLLSIMSVMDEQGFKSVQAALNMFGWFKRMNVESDGSQVPKLAISDKFVASTIGPFNQYVANEGFLFVAFYTTLFVSGLTPKFFAIDNVDASLNPKLSQALIKLLASLAKSHDKQVILTTHQPALLDGLDLRDDEQRLFVVYRDTRGKTKARRYNKPLPADYPKRISTLFIDGLVGGIPKGL